VSGAPLLLQDLVLQVVVAEVGGGKGAQDPQQVDGELHPLGQLLSTAFQQVRKNIVAVHPNRSEPREMVEPHVFELHTVPRDLEHGGHPALHRDRHVAQADRSMTRIEQRLGDDPDRIREIYEPCSTRAAAAGLLRQPHDHRDGAERFGEAARSGRLLPDAAETQGERLVAQPGLLPAHPDLRHHECRAVDRPIAVGRDHELPLPRPAPQNTPRDAAHDLQATGVDVEQRQLVDGKTLVVGDDALDELRCVGAAGADDRNLHAHADVTSSATASS
jgi:hypothetical protein